MMLWGRGITPRGPLPPQRRWQKPVTHITQHYTGWGYMKMSAGLYKEEPAAHSIIQSPKGCAVVHSHDSLFSSHTLISLFSPVSCGLRCLFVCVHQAGVETRRQRHTKENHEKQHVSGSIKNCNVLKEHVLHCRFYRFTRKSQLVCFCLSVSCMCLCVCRSVCVYVHLCV